MGFKVVSNTVQPGIIVLLTLIFPESSPLLQMIPLLDHVAEQIPLKKKRGGGNYKYWPPLGNPEPPTWLLHLLSPKIQKGEDPKVQIFLKKPQQFGRKMARSTWKHRGHSQWELIPAKPGSLLPAVSPFLLATLGSFPGFFLSIPQIFLLGEEEGQTLAGPWICPGNGAALQG